MQTMIREDGSEVPVVHFMYQDGKKWKIACTPTADDLHQLETRPFPYQRSEDVRAVRCTMCEATSVYLEAVKKLEQAMNAIWSGQATTCALCGKPR